jgi:hypothetical protein
MSAQVFNNVMLFNPPEQAWYGKPGEKFDVVLASDYESLRKRFEKACGELTARDTRIADLEAAINACNLSLKSYEAKYSQSDAGVVIETEAERKADVKVDRSLAWHLEGCVKRYGAQSDEPCECEKRSRNASAEQK